MSTTFIHQYALHDTILGRGFYSRIYLATHRKTHEKVAVKIIEKKKLVTSEEQSIPKRESNSLRKLQHCSNVIRLRDEMEDDHHHFLVLELADRSLRNELDKYPLGLDTEDECRTLACQIIQAVHNVHAVDAMHLDLHPGNILLNTNGDVKLADFGSSREMTLNDSVTSHGVEPRGTIPYAAPELTRGMLHAAADSWSIGAILYEIVTGCPPIVVNETVTFPDSLWGQKSRLAKDVIEQLMQSDPSKRMTASAALSHKWFA